MPGKIVHLELLASDADRATAFWSGLDTEGNAFSLWQADPNAA